MKKPIIYYMKNKKLVLIILSVILVISFFAGLIFGSVFIPLNELFADDVNRVILLNLRLPRVLGCLLSGCALSLSGLLLQRVTDNDLASPNVIGVNSGAGLGVMIGLCFIPDSTYILPLLAFIGAFITVIMVIFISSRVRTHLTNATLVLSGVAIGALLSAFINLLAQLYPDVLPSYVTFSTGGFSSVRMKDLLVPAIIIILCIIATCFLTKKLNLLMLGDELAQNLGVNVKRLKIVSLLLASLLASASVTYAGLLGFVGLMVPHIASKMVGNDSKIMIPASLLSGSVLVILSDLLGRTVFSPNEISAGIILAFLGVPFFIVLLFRKGVR